MALSLLIIINFSTGSIEANHYRCYCCRPAGTQRGPPADHQKYYPTEEPAPALQRGPAGAANPLPTGARDAGVTPTSTSLSMRRSTPQEERRATNWTERSGRSEDALLCLCAVCTWSGLNMEMLLSEEHRLQSLPQEQTSIP